MSIGALALPRLVSVNVGLPRDVAWKGRTVRTAIWKYPVRGRRGVGRLNVEGDGQADLAGHGGEQRAVYVYQLESYRYWQQKLRRTDSVYGQFGENLTVEGLADDVVCIGDRYRIGSALFEVTQPRVTCYRLGIRMKEPRMPALLTASGRPGFYLRVLQPGEVGAGDDIVKVGEAAEAMTVAEINALLYSSHHPRHRLQLALRIEALSPGWRASFEAMLRGDGDAAGNGNPGLVPAAAAHPVAPGFRSLAVTAIDRESADVLSLTMRSADDQPLRAALPGQYVILRLQPTPGALPLFRSYSLSGPASTERYRISVKIEPDGAAGTYVRDHVRVGASLDVTAPRGSFVLPGGERPLVLVSAGIGATPVLAMLHALAGERSTRSIWWVHGARDGRHHVFAAEAHRLLRELPHARGYVSYSRPGADDTITKDFDASGRLSRSVFDMLGVPPDADAYICGPARFMSDVKEALGALGVVQRRMHVELFNGSESTTPGIAAGSPAIAPHPPEDDGGAGSLVSFARSGVAAHWNASSYQSILELAEACDVPVRWSCRTGVCHTCESGLVSGAVAYEPEPLDRPAAGNVLPCCAQPVRDIVIDL